MTTSFISSFTELVFLNTTARSGVVIMPSTNIPGRILTFKDRAGTLFNSTITFSTATATQFFEDNAIRDTNSDTFGSYSFATGTDNKWYSIGGSYMNSAVISSITTAGAHFALVSTANTTISTLQISDSRLTSTATISLLSTNLYYSTPINFFVVGPAKAPKPLFLPLKSAFVPTQIAGLRYWYDASDPNVVQTSGSFLSRILNKGSSNQFSLQTASNTPRTGFTSPNGLNLIRLNPGDVLRYTGDYTAGNSRTHIILNRPLVNTLTTAVVYIWQNANVNADDYFALEVGRMLEISQGIAFTADANLPSNFSNIITISAFRTFTGTTASNTLSLNGSNLTLLQSSAPTYTNTVGGSPFFMNTNVNTTQELGEFLSWNTCLSLAEFQQVEGYLAWKWAIVNLLPATHPYKNSPP